jgi:hypothetical protein
MTDELDVLILVVQRLDRAGIPYMVSGSMAMNYYAQPRMTRDIDIVVELGPADGAQVVALFSADFYCDSDTIAEAIAHEGMFNLIHNESVVKVDCIVRKHSRYRRTEFERRRCIDVQGTKIVVVTAEDLLLSKLHWAKDSRSELQLRDARNLVLSVSDLDWNYLNTWAAELSVSALLSEVRS